LRWNKTTKEQRSEEMRKVARARWSRGIGWKELQEKKKAEVRSSVKRAIALSLIILGLLGGLGGKMTTYAIQEDKAPTISDLGQIDALVRPYREVMAEVSYYTASPDEIINKYAEDKRLVFRIATCESQMGKYRQNWEGSGAEGLLMFKPETFNFYCDGDIKSDIDQIKCFNHLYPKHPNWWECS